LTYEIRGTTPFWLDAIIKRGRTPFPAVVLKWSGGEFLGLFGEGEGVAVAFQNLATHEHVHNLCAHVRSESPKTLCLADGQTEAGHFLKLGADTDSKMLNIHLCDVFLQLIDGSLT